MADDCNDEGYSLFLVLLYPHPQFIHDLRFLRQVTFPSNLTSAARPLPATRCAIRNYIHTALPYGYLFYHPSVFRLHPTPRSGTYRAGVCSKVGLQNCAGDCLQLPHGVPSVDERGVIASRVRLHLLSIWDEK